MTDLIQAFYKASTGKITPKSEERLEVCLQCENKTEAFTSFIDFRIVKSKGLACSLCSCPLASKIFSVKKCEKWKI